MTDAVAIIVGIVIGVGIFRAPSLVAAGAASEAAFSVERPFRVPLYPVLPLVFCGMCLWLLHASLEYTRLGAVAGLAVLMLGAVPMWSEHSVQRFRAKETRDEALSIRPDLDRDGRVGIGV